MSQTTLQNYISRLVALLLALLLFGTCIPVGFAMETGNCGPSLSWQFEDGVLTITGSGAMSDYTEKSRAPWDHLTDSITQLSLPEGLTSIGNRAFYGCQNLRSITIPGSVQTIGEAAFFRNKSANTLTLNAGLISIKRSAFEECTSLIDLRLPGTVKEIGNHAFYCCESLSYVSIPETVKTFGTGIFSYCTRLTRVDMYADVNSLPGWSFFGCDSLTHLNVQGGTVDASAMKVNKDPVLLNPQVIISPDPEIIGGTSNTGTNTQPQASEETTPPPVGTETSQKTTLVGGSENSTIVADVIIPPEGSGKHNKVEITTTVINPEGWNDVLEMVQGVQGEQDEQKEPVIVTVYAPGTDVVPKNVLEDLAGQNAKVEINTQSGGRFGINCKDLNKNDIDSDLDLSYTLTRMEQIPEDIDSTEAFDLRFHASCNIKVEVMIQLPFENTKETACLFQTNKDNSHKFLQSVMVDGAAYAHFYLAAIDKEMLYIIAMDTNGVYVDQAIIPENLYDEYRLVDHSTGKEYVITGRKSSWNMGLGRVMAILAVVMVSAIVVVGAVMFFWNKQRLKNGYVPKWDDDEE